jgi:metal-sulfur cluster biosynthetic enzyme
MDSFDVASAMASRSDDEEKVIEAGAATDAAPAGTAAPDRATVMAALRACYDPCCRERGVSIVDLGLIQEVQVEDGRVSVAMLLTSGWCPFSASLERMIETEVRRLPGVSEVAVEVVWNPVWTPERMSEEARSKLALPMVQLLPLREARLQQQQQHLQG